MKIRNVVKIISSVLVFFYLLASFTTAVSAAEFTTNGTEVHIKPDAAHGQELVSQVKGSNVLGDILDILTYLIYTIAIIDVLYCTLVILGGVLAGNKINSFKSMKGELEAKNDLWKITKSIAYMWVAINAMDFIYYYL